ASSHTSDGGASLGVLGINNAETTEDDVAAGVFGQAPGYHNPVQNFGGKVVGVWGESWSTNPDGAGVVGKNNASSGSTRGVYGESKSPNGAGVWGENTRSSGYAVYAHGNLHIEDGNLTITNGVKNAVVPTSRGMTKLYCEESAEVWFTDYGFGTLTAGQCTVQLDPLFMETVTVNDRYTMMVSVEFYGPHGNHYVERDQDSFTVVDPSGSNSQFSWQVRAKRNGYETARLEDYDQSDTN
ncbi:hypothetical protein KKA01_02760, partial [Patescibacteria group bacterium]|nr:hypothetical protein [Patescibacteria group bacterium]